MRHFLNSEGRLDAWIINLGILNDLCIIKLSGLENGVIEAKGTWTVDGMGLDIRQEVLLLAARLLLLV